jgi:DNA-binding transcriptional LysR family regulator
LGHAAPFFEKSGGEKFQSGTDESSYCQSPHCPRSSRYQKKYPEIKPQLKMGNTDLIQRMVDSREIDYGIVVDEGEVGAIYQTQKIYTTKLLIVKSPRFKGGGSQGKYFEKSHDI